jgi:glucokinase
MSATGEKRPNHILGLDIGGTTCAVVLGDRAGRIHERNEFETRAERGFDAVFDELCKTTEHIARLAAETGRAPTALSVSIGGPLDIERGIIYSPPNLPGWDTIPLKQLLADRFNLPAFIEHDGNAGALAEWYFGAARGARHAVFLTMGTGLGGGLILNGELFRGACDLAGEVGHISLAENGPSGHGKAGSWEGFCSGAGIAKLAALRFPQRWADGRITAWQLGELARADDSDANAVLSEAGRMLGRGLAILLDALNPEVIVIGALAVRLGELVLAPARDEMRRLALPAAVAACRVVAAELGERLGDVAALCAAIAASGGPRAPEAA